MPDLTPIDHDPFMITDGATPPQNLLERARSQYPILKDYNYGYVENFQPNAGFLEHWGRGEPGSAPSSDESLDRLRPKELPIDMEGLEIRDKNTRPIDILGDVVSHNLVNSDPVVKKTYEDFQKSLNPKQQKILAEQYQYAKANEGETRSFEDWSSAAGIPAYFRGYAFKQWPDDFNKSAYTPDQMKTLDRMMKYLGSPKLTPVDHDPFVGEAPK